MVDRRKVSASVTHRSIGHAMIMSTPTKTVQELAIQFVLKAAADHTDLAVTEINAKSAWKAGRSMWRREAARAGPISHALAPL